MESSVFNNRCMRLSLLTTKCQMCLEKRSLILADASLLFAKLFLYAFAILLNGYVIWELSHCIVCQENGKHLGNQCM